MGNRRSIACGAPPILLNVWRRHHCRPNQLHLLNSMSYQVLDNLTVHPTAQLGPYPWLALCNSDENIYWYTFVKLHTARPKCNSSKKGSSEIFVLKNRRCEEQAWRYCRLSVRVSPLLTPPSSCLFFPGGRFNCFGYLLPLPRLFVKYASNVVATCISFDRFMRRLRFSSPLLFLR